jgi:beta-galactosidase GanA
VAFVELAQKIGFVVILRVGPWVTTTWFLNFNW